MNTVIKMLEREIQIKQKCLHQWNVLTVTKNRPEKILQEIADLKVAIRLLKQQWLKAEKKKFMLE